MQHVIAMFGATFLVPLLTGFPPTTTVFFSGVGTIIFLIVTRNKIPSYLGSSFAFIAPVIASMGVDKNIGLALGGIVAAGFMLFLVGLLVNRIGHQWINVLMPPVVTGAIVMLIGLNLAPVAVKKRDQQLGLLVADHCRHRRDRCNAQRFSRADLDFPGRCRCLDHRCADRRGRRESDRGAAKRRVVRLANSTRRSLRCSRSCS